MPRITKEQLAKQNADLRAELSRAKSDLERALAHIQTLESERRAKPAKPQASKKQLSRAELMQHAKHVAQSEHVVTQIRDGQVQKKVNGQWLAA